MEAKKIVEEKIGKKMKNKLFGMKENERDKKVKRKKIISRAHKKKKKKLSQN